jgi:hypothetical protein
MARPRVPLDGPGEGWPDARTHRNLLLLFFITLGLELSDTKVYAPYIRALLGTAAQYCEAVVLEPSTAPFGTAQALASDMNTARWTLFVSDSTRVTSPGGSSMDPLGDPGQGILDDNAPKI